MNYSIIPVADGSFFSGNPDYFITFIFKVNDITNAIAGKTPENVVFTSASPIVILFARVFPGGIGFYDVTETHWVYIYQHHG